MQQLYTRVYTDGTVGGIIRVMFRTLILSALADAHGNRQNGWLKHTVPFEKRFIQH
jgi:hypothetical protein